MVLLPLRKAQFISVGETCRARKRLPVHAAFAADIGERARLRRVSRRPPRRPRASALARSTGSRTGHPTAAPKNTGAGQRNTQKFRRDRPARTQKHRRNPAGTPKLRANLRVLQIRAEANSNPFALSEAEPPGRAGRPPLRRPYNLRAILPARRACVYLGSLTLARSLPRSRLQRTPRCLPLDTPCATIAPQYAPLYTRTPTDRETLWLSMKNTPATVSRNSKP